MSHSLAGVCVGQTDISGNYEPPFKPILRMWPSSVVPTRGNVTLRCITSTRDVKCVIKKGVLTTQTSNLLVISGWTGTIEFLLTELQQSDAEYYTCECSKSEDSDAMSSDASLLLVTGHLPKPSLQSHQWSKVTAGGNVTLHCRKPDNMTEYTMFMLLKEGIPSPIQVQSSESNRADFSLHNVTATDTGNYSCVYHQKEAPFWASHPSDHFKILVSVVLVVVVMVLELRMVLVLVVVVVMIVGGCDGDGRSDGGGGGDGLLVVVVIVVWMSLLLSALR
uniref:Ig-like domain-containing protein n=1 Tax=Peromyscus maniculatus bairdii TaxID=230844 RepID=A0A8C8UAL7_PERMB